MRRPFQRILGMTSFLTLLASTALAQDGAAGATASASTQAQVVAAASRAAKPSAEAAPKPLATQGAAPAPSARGPSLGPDEHARLLREASLAMSGADPVAIQEALQTLASVSGRAAAEVIVARVRGGLPPQLTEQALEVLGVLNQPLASPVLVELTQHRRWQIRQKAINALGALRVRSTVSVLLFALDDPSPEVRASAAAALGNMGDPRAMAPLTAALERGVDGALIAIARLATSKQLDFVIARAKSDMKAGEPALWAWISRTNAPAATKLKIVKTLDSWNTEEARDVLGRWQQQLHEGQGDPRLLSAFKPVAAQAGGKP